MVETLCDSGAVKLKVGLNATVLTAEQYTQLINQAEGAIAVESGKDYVADYSGYSDNYKKILEDAASSHAAMSTLGYDLNANSLATSQSILDINWTRFTNAMKLLKDKKAVDFVSGA